MALAGLKLGGRGEIVAMRHPSDNDVMIILSGAHLVEAGYEAYAADPTNPQITASISQPLEVTLLDDRTPVGVLDYFIEDGNSLNSLKGVISFVDQLLKVDKIQSTKGGGEQEEQIEGADVVAADEVDTPQKKE